jgi:hypothetical protein
MSGDVATSITRNTGFYPGARAVTRSATLAIPLCTEHMPKFAALVTQRRRGRFVERGSSHRATSSPHPQARTSPICVSIQGAVAERLCSAREKVTYRLTVMLA